MAQYADFIEQNIAPYAASKIGVYNADGTRVGYIALGSFKPDYGTRLYRFGLLADVHNEDEADSSVYYADSENAEDIQRALTYFNEKQSVALTCIAGDVSGTGTQANFEYHKELCDTYSADTPVYACAGNHDATTSGLDETTWTTYTGYDKNFVIDKTVGDKTDHFIFISQDLWGNPTDALYTSDDMDWLETQLETYKNERCFVFMHLFFPDYCGNLKEIYPSGNWLGGTCLTRLKGMCDKYLNTVWFSGHSHWKWYLQKYQTNANIYRGFDSDGNPTTGWCVHVPSCGLPIDSDGVSTRVTMLAESEGAIVDVYEDYIDIRGMNLKDGLYLPIAQYRLDTTLQTIADSGSDTTSDYLTADDFTVNSVKNSGCTATQLDDDYVLLYFTMKSQGFLITNDSYTSSSTAATLDYCEIGFYSDEDCTTEVTLSSSALAKIGFYTTSGTYTTEAGALLEVNASSSQSGAQFNTSSSYVTNGGTVPIYVKLKAKITFS